MKTAISISDDLFEGVARIAEEQGVSRSKVFAYAVQEYLEKHKNRKLLSALNAAYSEEETPKEKDLRKSARKYYARRIRKEKW